MPTGGRTETGYRIIGPSRCTNIAFLPADGKIHLRVGKPLDCRAMFRLPLRSIGTFVSIAAVMGCDRQAGAAPPRFRLLSPAETGVTFANTITTTDSVNVQTNVYIYNGAGVAVGDIDNDGLPDIFFAGNMVS